MKPRPELIHKINVNGQHKRNWIKSEQIKHFGLFSPFNSAHFCPYHSLNKAKTKERSLGEWDNELHRLSQTLSKKFPEQALEVAEMISTNAYKCQALLSIIRKGNDS